MFRVCHKKAFCDAFQAERVSHHCSCEIIEKDVLHKSHAPRVDARALAGARFVFPDKEMSQMCSTYTALKFVAQLPRRHVVARNNGAGVIIIKVGPSTSQPRNQTTVKLQKFVSNPGGTPSPLRINFKAQLLKEIT